MKILKFFPCLKKKSSSGEYCGSCPQCGGKDRFILWVEQDKGGKCGRYYCRQCNITGDGVDYLCKFLKYDFFEACKELDVLPSYYDSNLQNRKKCITPQAVEVPNIPFVGQGGEIAFEKWSEAATNFFQSCLNDGSQEKLREFYEERGLSMASGHEKRIAWNARDRYFFKADWGIPSERSEKFIIPARSSYCSA